jgi:hypothetical protein
VSPAFQGNTLAHGGYASAAPGINTVVAELVAPAAGTYSVKVTIALTGTAETALRNLLLRENGNTVMTQIPTLSGLIYTVELERVEINEGGGDLEVATLAAATGGSIYNVILLATRIG